MELKPNLKQRAQSLSWNKAMVGLLVMGFVVVIEFITIGTIVALGQPVPTEMWDAVRLTLVSLAGVVGAQALNGKVKT